MSKSPSKNKTLVNNRKFDRRKIGHTLDFDLIDKSLLKLVIDNSRLSFRELARRLGVSVGTVIERLSRLESSGTIESYSAFINSAKIGFPLTAVIEIYGKTGSSPFDKYLAKLPNVYCVYSVTGRIDTIVIAKFRDINEINSFIRGIQRKRGVARTETLLVIDTHKEDFRPTIE